MIYNQCGKSVQAGIHLRFYYSNRGKTDFSNYRTKMHKMIRITCILFTMLSFSILIACGSKTKESIPNFDAETELVVENTTSVESVPEVAPTLDPTMEWYAEFVTPVPDLNSGILTVEPAAAPLALPGKTLIGKIAMDNAKSAQITLRVSADGKLIEGLGFSFTELKCEGFSAGSMSTQMTLREPVTNGKFEFSSSVGVINGQFTSPTAVQGSIHLKFNQKPIGEFECGTWNWSAEYK